MTAQTVQTIISGMQASIATINAEITELSRERDTLLRIEQELIAIRGGAPVPASPAASATLEPEVVDGPEVFSIKSLPASSSLPPLSIKMTSACVAKAKTRKPLAHNVNSTWDSLGRLIRRSGEAGVSRAQIDRAFSDRKARTITYYLQQMILGGVVHERAKRFVMILSEEEKATPVPDNWQMTLRTW